MVRNKMILTFRLSKRIGNFRFHSRLKIYTIIRRKENEENILTTRGGVHSEDNNIFPYKLASLPHSQASGTLYYNTEGALFLTAANENERGERHVLRHASKVKPIIGIQQNCRWNEPSSSTSPNWQCKKQIISKRFFFKFVIFLSHLKVSILKKVWKHLNLKFEILLLISFFLVLVKNSFKFFWPIWKYNCWKKNFKTNFSFENRKIDRNLKSVISS